MVTCAICHDLIPSETSAAAKCGHVLHNSCWMTWLKRSSNCPVCRQRTSKKDLIRLFLNHEGSDKPVDTKNDKPTFVTSEPSVDSNNSTTGVGLSVEDVGSEGSWTDVSEDSLSDESGSEESLSDESGSEESLSDESGSEESLSDESGSEESLSDESGSEDSLSDESGSEDSLSEESESEDSLSEESESEDSLSDESRSEDSSRYESGDGSENYETGSDLE